MNRFDKYIDQLLKNEGGYVNDPKDAGGETKYGISKRAYPNVDIKNLTIDGAKAIYRKDYWNDKYDLLRDERLAFRLFDVGVNLGVRQAVKLLQNALKDKFSSTITVDGDFGMQTLNECNRIGEAVYDAYIARLEQYYHGIVERNPDNQKFLKGWMNRLHHVYVT